MVPLKRVVLTTSLTYEVKAWVEPTSRFRRGGSSPEELLTTGLANPLGRLLVDQVTRVGEPSRTRPPCD